MSARCAPARDRSRPLCPVREAPDDNGTNAPLILEFIGLPGAGKSTIARTLLSHFAAAGYEGIVTVGAKMITSQGLLLPPARGSTRVRRSVRHARFLARRPQLVHAVGRYGAGVRPRSVERLGFVWSVLDYAFQLTEHHMRPVDVVVLDQASLQAAWSVLVRGSPPSPERTDRLLAELLHCAPNRWAVAHFDVDQDTALERIASRPTNTSRFDHMAPEEARALLPDLTRHLETMVSRLQANGVPCVRLDARLPAEATCSALMRFVRAVVPPCPPARRST